MSVILRRRGDGVFGALRGWWGWDALSAEKPRQSLLQNPFLGEKDPRELISGFGWRSEAKRLAGEERTRLQGGGGAVPYETGAARSSHATSPFVFSKLRARETATFSEGGRSSSRRAFSSRPESPGPVQRTSLAARRGGVRSAAWRFHFRSLRLSRRRRGLVARIPGEGRGGDGAFVFRFPQRAIPFSARPCLAPRLLWSLTWGRTLCGRGLRGRPCRESSRVRWWVRRRRPFCLRPRDTRLMEEADTRLARGETARAESLPP